MEKLTVQEEMVMLSIWQIGDGAVKDVINNMKDGDTIPYTTVASIVKNLERKGFVSSKRYGNVYVYSAKISQDEYKKRCLNGIAQSYFTNSYRDMVSFFVEQKKISADELRELISIIEKTDK